MEKTLNDIIREHVEGNDENACTCIVECDNCDADVCANCEHYISADKIDLLFERSKEK